LTVTVPPDRLVGGLEQYTALSTQSGMVMFWQIIIVEFSELLVLGQVRSLRPPDTVQNLKQFQIESFLLKGFTKQKKLAVFAVNKLYLDVKWSSLFLTHLDCMLR